ncbi:MAG TPA: hypothetical protein VJU77_09965 [Chthoniobacterales bacterium]|nr:hypothetical protein [Chthoniobacterales bacterium]
MSHPHFHVVRRGVTRPLVLTPSLKRRIWDALIRRAMVELGNYDNRSPTPPNRLRFTRMTRIV